MDYLEVLNCVASLFLSFAIGICVGCMIVYLVEHKEKAKPIDMPEADEAIEDASPAIMTEKCWFCGKTDFVENLVHMRTHQMVNLLGLQTQPLIPFQCVAIGDKYLTYNYGDYIRFHAECAGLEACNCVDGWRAKKKEKEEV